MIKLSNLADYAVVLMSNIAARPSDVHTALELNADTKVPLPTVSKILGKMVRAGLLKSNRGIGGGFSMNLEIENISIADIIEAVDGPVQLTNCLTEHDTCCDYEPVCLTRHKWDKINDKGKPSYKRFYGPPFLLQISGSGLVAPSGMFFNARYSKLHIGDFTSERFIDIFKSDKYWRAMNYLASPAFDAQTMMGTLPIQHYISTALDNHVKGTKKIVAANGEKPLHFNFL